jgi:hypothetical protein
MVVLNQGAYGMRKGTEVGVRADFIVTMDGVKYVVEVKGKDLDSLLEDFARAMRDRNAAIKATNEWKPKVTNHEMKQAILYPQAYKLSDNCDGALYLFNRADQPSLEAAEGPAKELLDLLRKLGWEPEYYDAVDFNAIVNGVIHKGTSH